MTNNVRDAPAPLARLLPIDQIGDAAVRSVLQVWHRGRGDRSMPRRDSILPEDMPAALGRVNLVEVSAQPPRYRFRLVGSIIGDIHGRNYSGKTVDDIEPPEYRELIRRTYDEAVAARAPVAHHISWNSSAGDLAYVRASLPLSDDDAAVHMLMTCTVVNYDWRKLFRGV